MRNIQSGGTSLCKHKDFEKIVQGTSYVLGEIVSCGGEVEELVKKQTWLLMAGLLLKCANQKRINVSQNQFVCGTLCVVSSPLFIAFIKSVLKNLHFMAYLLFISYYYDFILVFY